jgi:hypothetical protein
MKKLLIAAGVAGLAYYLKQHPEMVDSMKSKATDALNKLKGRESSSTSSNSYTTDHVA